MADLQQLTQALQQMEQRMQELSQALGQRDVTIATLTAQVQHLASIWL